MILWHTCFCPLRILWHGLWGKCNRPFGLHEGKQGCSFLLLDHTCGERAIVYCSQWIFFAWTLWHMQSLNCGYFMQRSFLRSCLGLIPYRLSVPLGRTCAVGQNINLLRLTFDWGGARTCLREVRGTRESWLSRRAGIRRGKAGEFSGGVSVSWACKSVLFLSDFVLA